MLAANLGTSGYRVLGVVLALATICLPIKGFGQDACQSAVNEAKTSCQDSITQAGNSSPSAAGAGSMGMSAALQGVQSMSQIGSLNFAISSCEKQRAKCQSSCGLPSTGGGSGGSGGSASDPSTQRKCNGPGDFTRAGTAVNGIPIMAAKDCNPSPLVVQLPPPGEMPEPIALSSRLAGILFDILGLNSFPHAFDKQQISWLLPRSRLTNYFVVLPDAEGRVLGINQLFGNNTLGPDNRFADNGFLALAKYDGRRGDGSFDLSAQDKKIDAHDEVFANLRLWSDVNGDGIAQDSELFTLNQAHVGFIDLDYDPNFAEQDVYGNEIRTKSIVRTTDGEMHIIYDLWFNLSNASL